ncbi:MAG: flagellar hook-associated protein FlgL [Pseudomonadota bacterium]
MRVSTAALIRQAIGNIQERQVAIAGLQNQISSGQRIGTPSDDPLSSARIRGIDDSLARLAQYDRNGGRAADRLNIEEGALAGMTDLLQRVRELVVQGANATQSSETRSLIAAEIVGLRNTLIDLGNTRDGQGEFVFAGLKSTTLPFVEVGGSVQYFGDRNERELQIGAQRRVVDGDPGSRVLLALPAGNGDFEVSTGVNTGTLAVRATSVADPTAFTQDDYVITFTSETDFEVATDPGGVIVDTGTLDGSDVLATQGVLIEFDGAPAAGDTLALDARARQDVFASLDRIIAALDRGSVDEAGLAIVRSELNSGLENLDQALVRLVEVRADVGVRLNAIEDQTLAHSQLDLELRATRSTLADTDLATAISDLNLQLTSLQAAQQSFARTQNLSLFNFL